MSSEKYTALRQQAAALPLVPGVYQFVDADGTVLYVGKAKSLRKRVANYFAESRIPSKIRIMVRRAVELRHIVTDSETDALLLENSLIKTLQPHFNAMLKDDKTYPWIVVRNEPFPRIRSTRQVVRDGSLYFGPYASIGVQKNLLEILHAVFQFRTCKLNLAPAEVAKGKYRPCLQYHLGNCKAPCVGKQSAADYDASVEMARAMLRDELYPRLFLASVALTFFAKIECSSRFCIQYF
jgi:excinuclease ABC subunit C